jgi:phosphoglycolate phosphatase-like HAD superfamily hydrolase
VGDSDIDLECAKKGNMTAVLYGTENYQQQFIEQYKIAANVDNHLELIELIKNYCG